MWYLSNYRFMIFKKTLFRRETIRAEKIISAFPFLLIIVFYTDINLVRKTRNNSLYLFSIRFVNCN